MWQSGSEEVLTLIVFFKDIWQMILCLYFSNRVNLAFAWQIHNELGNSDQTSAVDKAQFALLGNDDGHLHGVQQHLPVGPGHATQSQSDKVRCQLLRSLIASRTYVYALMQKQGKG